MTHELTDRILAVLAQPEWQKEPPGSGLIAEILHERRRDVMAALDVLKIEGKVTDAGGGNPHVARAGWALTKPDTSR